MVVVVDGVTLSVFLGTVMYLFTWRCPTRRELYDRKLECSESWFTTPRRLCYCTSKWVSLIYGIHTQYYEINMLHVNEF